jgi:hypothetical protein
MNWIKGDLCRNYCKSLGGNWKNIMEVRKYKNFIFFGGMMIFMFVPGKNVMWPINS